MGEVGARAAWRGWPTTAEEGWIDLSLPIGEDVRRISVFPGPRITRTMSMPQDPLNLTELSMSCHVGTHVDAPCHFLPDGPSIDEVGLDHLCGPGAVARIDGSVPHAILPGELEHVDLRPGDILVLDTGWWQRVDRSGEDHCHLHVDTASWLVERQVKLVGMDAPTPDLPVPSRGPGFDWPVHHVLLSQGVLIAENLTNLVAELTGRVSLLFLPMPIVGADGAPARVLARPLGA